MSLKEVQVAYSCIVIQLEVQLYKFILAELTRHQFMLHYRMLVHADLNWQGAFRKMISVCVFMIVKPGRQSLSAFAKANFRLLLWDIANPGRCQYNTVKLKIRLYQGTLLAAFSFSSTLLMKMTLKTPIMILQLN